MTNMYDIAITYGVLSLLLLGGYTYLTVKMTKITKEKKVPGEDIIFDSFFKNY